MAQRGGARPGAGRKRGKIEPRKRDLIEAAKGYADAALEVLLSIAKNTEAPAAARVAAANAIIDRGYGKPKQAIVGGDEDDAPIAIRRVERIVIDPTDRDA